MTDTRMLWTITVQLRDYPVPGGDRAVELGWARQNAELKAFYLGVTLPDGDPEIIDCCWPDKVARWSWYE